MSANGSAHVVNYRPATDCFYVYPNISHQRTTNATLHIDPQETAIAELEASPFSWVCRVFAPMYREVIPTGPEGGEAASIAYRSVLDAWRDYLDRYNDRRGVVLIGHSEGSGMLFQLIAREIDPDPSIRHRVVLATLLGLDMPVGVDGAGPFAHIGACGSSSTLGCVVGYNAYSQPPPPGSLFGRAVPSVFDGVEQKDLCTDPAALDGGAGTLISLYRTHLATQEVAGGTTEGVFGVHPPTSATPWIEYDRRYTARCVDRSGRQVLLVEPVNGAPGLVAAPTPAWGLHLDDPNLALGNLVDLVHSEATAYLMLRPTGSP